MGEQVTRVTSLSALSCNSKARKLALCLSSAGNVGRRAGNERSGCSRGESRESEREDCGLHDEMMFLVFPLPREYLAEPKEWTVVPSGVGWPSPLLYNFLVHHSRALPRRKKHNSYKQHDSNQHANDSDLQSHAVVVSLGFCCSTALTHAPARTRTQNGR